MFFFILMAQKSLDDHYYFENSIAYQGDMWGYMQMRYATWTSRVLIEALLLKVISGGMLLWKILNSIVWLILGVMLSKTLKCRNNLRMNWLIVALMACYPIVDLKSAGWVATTVNYLWPLTAGVIAMYPLIKYHRRQRIALLEYIPYYICLIFAINLEQIAFAMIIFLGVHLMVGLLHRRLFLYNVIALALSVASMVFILNCPGNYVRRVSDKASWFVDFDLLSLPQKAEIGLTAAFKFWFFESNTLMMVFCVLLAILMFNRYKQILYRVIATLPAALCLVFGTFYGVLKDAFPGLKKVVDSLDKYGAVNVSFNVKGGYIALFLMCAAFVCILLMLYLLYDGRPLRQILLITLIVTGFLTKMSLSISPTVWASGKRTSIFFYISVMMVFVILVRDFSVQLKKRYMGNYPYLKFALGTVAALSLVSNYLL